MIFTAEESREIAEGVLGWKPRGGGLVPDFSAPEWTGPMQDALLNLGWKHSVLVEIRMSNNQGKRIQYVMATRFVRGVLSSETQGFDGPYPKQLFDCWKYLKEASDV